MARAAYIVKLSPAKSMATLLKKCPSCGKRFEVRRTGEVMTSSQKQVVFVEKPQNSMSQEMGRSTFSAGPLPDAGSSLPPTIEPVAVERDVIEDSYTCKHCGHNWVETREILKKERGGEVRGRIVSDGAP